MLSKSRYPSGFTAENEDVRAEALEIDSPVNGYTIYMPCHRDFDAHRAIILKVCSISRVCRDTEELTIGLDSKPHLRCI